MLIDNIYGIVLLVFYILLVIVLGQTFKTPSQTDNKELLITLRVFAYLVLVLSCLSLLSLITTTILILKMPWILLIMLPFVILPIIISAFVAVNKHLQPNNRKMLIVLVWFHISLIILAVLATPYLTTVMMKHLKIVPGNIIQIRYVKSTTPKKKKIKTKTTGGRK